MGTGAGAAGVPPYPGGGAGWGAFGFAEITPAGMLEVTPGLITFAE